MNKKYPIILFSIIFIAAAFYFLLTPRNNTISSVEKIFKVRDTYDISRIDIIKNGENIKIEKWKDNKWRINDIYFGREEIINKLIGLISKFEINSRVAGSYLNRVMDEFNENAIEINLYKNKRILKQFIISKITIEDNEITAISKNREEIYALNVTGFPYLLYSVFNTNADFLRDKTLLHILPEQIVSIKLKHNQSPQHSFHLSKTGKTGYKINSINNLKIEEYDPGKVELYLGYFQHIKFEKEITGNENNLYDSLEQTVPLYKAGIIYSGSNPVNFLVYNRPISQRKNILGKEITVDPDFCYVTLNGQLSVYLVKYTEIEHVIKNIDYFIKE